MPPGLTSQLAQASPDPTKPSGKAFAITPSDTVDLPAVVRAISVGSAGDIAVVPEENADGSPVTLANRASGTDVRGYRIRRVMATGTTATGLVGWE